MFFSVHDQTNGTDVPSALRGNPYRGREGSGRKDLHDPVGVFRKIPTFVTSVSNQRHLANCKPCDGSSFQIKACFILLMTFNHGLKIGYVNVILCAKLIYCSLRLFCCRYLIRSHITIDASLCKGFQSDVYQFFISDFQIIR